MLRILLLTLLLAGLQTTGPAEAASRLPGLAPLAKPTAEAPAQGEADAAARKAGIDALIAALEDPATRGALLGRLKALNGTPSPKPPPSPAAPLSGAVQQLSGAFTSQITSTTTEGVSGLSNAISALPLLATWLRAQFQDEATRSLWAGIGEQAGLAALLGFVGSLIVRALMRPWRARREVPDPLAAWRLRLAAATAHLVVDLAALATFLGVTFAALAILGASALSRQIALDILLGILIGRSLTAAVKALLAARDPGRRLLPIADGHARALQRRLVVIAGLSSYGYFTLQAGLDLGLPYIDYKLLLHLLFGLVALTFIIMIVGFRPQVARWIETWGQSSRSVLAGYLPWRGIAASGHMALAACVLVLYVVWALEVPGGTLLLVRGILATALVIFGQRLLIIWAERRLRPRIDAAAAESGAADKPDADPPARVAHTTALLAVRIVVITLAIAVVLQAWGLNLVLWLGTDTGSTLALVALRLGLILGLAVVLGQLTNRLARRYLEARDEAGVLIHSNRGRTLASILRNLVLVSLAFIAVINALAEVGVNATALFAGAGVVGLAVGFGSQRLVQDLITGLFILMGDSVRVGDVVELGGKSGAVEAMTMRTVTLRGYDGLVYTIPYSSIDVVTNMTKDFSFCVLEVAVGYDEDVEEVIDVLRELDQQLRREWPYRRQILEPIDIAGLDRFADSAIMVKARIKTRPGNQWSIGFEFRKRMKARFAEKGIEIPYPHRKLVFAPGAGPVVPALTTVPPAVPQDGPGRGEREGAGRERNTALVRGA